MKLSTRIFVALGVVVVVLGVLGVVFLQSIQRWFVVAYTQEYKPPVVPPSGPKPQGVRWVKVAEGFNQPTDVQFVPGGHGGAVVLEKAGVARYCVPARPGDAPTKPLEVPPLQLSVRTDSELGLLGLAFHPDYATNGLFYVNENPTGGEMRTRIAEWKLSPDSLGKEKATGERVLLEVKQPYQNHNAGQLAFGKDGFLYIGLGDGGFRGDPHANGQNLGVLLGKMLRVDVAGRSEGAYGIPRDNPFVGTDGARPEIWAYGLRNPWRFSFAPDGRMVAADVGQDTWEEVDVVKAGDNLGWNAREARHCFDPKENCPREGLVEPIFEYGHESGTSITGGYVYTGADVPALQGEYVFADFTSGRVWALKLPSLYLPSTELSTARVLGQWPFLVSSFGRDEAGELYLLDFAGGDLYRLAVG